MNGFIKSFFVNAFSVKVLQELEDFLFRLINSEFLILIKNVVVIADVNTVWLAEVKKVKGIVPIASQEEDLGNHKRNLLRDENNF